MPEFLRQLAYKVHNGWADPEAMSLDGVGFDCGRVGNESMSESRKRWVKFIMDIANRSDLGESLRIEVREVWTTDTWPKFALHAAVETEAT